jgi:hypothetical protein
MCIDDLGYQEKEIFFIFTDYRLKPINSIILYDQPGCLDHETILKVKQKIDTYSGYDLCQNCYHRREIHLGVCMLEKDKQFPCDCIEFKEIERKK